MNKILSFYIIGIVLFAGLIFVAGCNIDNPDRQNSALQNLSANSELKKFNSTDEIEQFLSQRQSVALRNGGMMAFDSATPTAAKAESSGAGYADYSQTNVQIEGIDEADFVKNDGKYIYLVKANRLLIIDAFDTKDIISDTKLPDNVYASSMFLDGDNVVVIATTNEESFYFNKYDIMPQPNYEAVTKVMIYDVTDRSSPELSEDFKVSGDYFQSRMKDGIVYLVAIKYAQGNVHPPIIYAKSVINPDVYYFDGNEQQYNYNTLVSIDIAQKEVIDSQTYLLGYGNTLMMSDNNIYIAYQNQRCWRWYCADQQYEKERFTQVVVPLLEGDLKKDIQGILNQDLPEEKEWGLISDRLTTFYEELRDDQKMQDQYDKMFENIQQALDEYDTKKELENSKTTIHKIGIDAGRFEYVAKAQIDGRLLNQYSMDESKGYLRVATTIDIWMNSGRKTYNNIYVLDEQMDVVGTLDDVAKNETIYSTRFMGDRLYMVTYRQMDPFFVIDLSDPKEPQILGQLKIPGYSSYLHPYGENLIIGIGKETAQDEYGTVSTKGVKISMFDVSDVANPVEIDKYEIGMEGTDSPILYDPKAFTLFDGKLVIPISEVTSRNTGRYGYDYSYWDGAYVFDVSKEGFDLIGKVKHDSRSSSYYGWWDRASVTRSIIMDNDLFTISDKYVKVNDLSNDLESVASIDLPDLNRYDGPYYGPMVK